VLPGSWCRNWTKPPSPRHSRSSRRWIRWVSGAWRAQQGPIQQGRHPRRPRGVAEPVGGCRPGARRRRHRAGWNPQQVADRIKEYAALGLDYFVLSGYPHLEEAHRFAELVFPLLPLDLQDKLPGRTLTGPFGEIVANSYVPKPLGLTRRRLFETMTTITSTSASVQGVDHIHCDPDRRRAAARTSTKDCSACGKCAIPNLTAGHAALFARLAAPGPERRPIHGVAPQAHIALRVRRLGALTKALHRSAIASMWHRWPAGRTRLRRRPVRQST